MNNPLKGAKLMEQAEDIEDVMMKESNEANAQVTLFKPVRNMLLLAWCSALYP